MKAMKSLSMGRMLGSARRRGAGSQDEASETGASGPQLDTPEANASRGVRLFCESGGPNNSGEEVLYLPTIVEAAESSPVAAKECAQGIRKFLKKDNMSRPHVQYNAIMLLRILADNPGPTFTRNLDKQFADTIKELLRYGRDPSVKQILMETMHSFEREKQADENLKVLIDMWKKEQDKMNKEYSKGGALTGPRSFNTAPVDPHSQNYFSRSHSTNRGLPNPQELASRIEEARTSAKLLTQVVQSTPPAEFLQNDLIKEFSDRCTSASRSIQGYISSQDPAPDNDTMLTLIETNEQIALALSKHQRAVLQTRRAFGLGDTPSPSLEGFAPPPGPPLSQIQPPPGPPPSASNQSNLSSRKKVPSPPIASLPDSESGPQLPELASTEFNEDPFKDPVTNSRPKASQPPTDEFSVMGIEPYHPGFNPTQSYVGRQDSSIGNVTMHAAVEKDDDGDDDEYAAPVQQTRKAPIYRY